MNEIRNRLCGWVDGYSRELKTDQSHHLLHFRAGNALSVVFCIAQANLLCSGQPGPTIRIRQILQGAKPCRNKNHKRRNASLICTIGKIKGKFEGWHLTDWYPFETICAPTWGRFHTLLKIASGTQAPLQRKQQMHCQRMCWRRRMEKLDR